MTTDRKTRAQVEWEIAELRRRLDELDGDGEGSARGVLDEATDEHYRDLFLNARVGLFRIRFEDGRILAANDEAFSMLGYEGVSGDSVDAFIPQDAYIDPDTKARLITELKMHGEVRGFEAEFRHRMGSIVRLRISARWLRDQGWVEGVIEDVSDRARAELARGESEERFRAIFESARDCIFVKDRDLRYTHVNSAVGELFDRPADQLIGVTDDGLFDAATLARVRDIDRRVLAGEVLEGENTTLVGGVEYTFHTVKVPLRAADGTVVGLCGIARDISDLKRAQRVERVLGGILTAAATSGDLKTLISRTRELLGTLIDTSNFYVALYDETSGRYSFPFYVDRYDALEQFEPEPLPKSLTDYVRRTGRPILVGHEEFDELVQRNEVELTGTDSEQWLGAPLIVDRRVIGVVSVQSYNDPDLYSDSDLDLLHYAAGTISIAVERKRAEAQRRTLEAKLHQVQKLESLGVLAGGIAHEFNNLLQGILGSTGLVDQNLDADSPLRKHIAMIEKAADDAALLTRQMLAFSGKGRFMVEDIDLSTVVEDMRPLIDASVSQAAELRFELSSDLPVIRSDAAEIRQVVNNLVTNASDALADQSGTIWIRTGTVGCDRQALVGTYLGEELDAGTYLFLEVEDTGSGMDPDTLEKIFEPFFSTKFTGRGLGLAAVLGIVRGNKGTLKVSSEEGSGTTIRVLLPPAQHIDLSDVVREAVAATQPVRPTVLVVDDDDTVRSLSRQMLEEAGYEVLTACDGHEALDVYRGSVTAIDAIILDMTMPRMNGEETFRELRLISEDVRVVVSSGYTEQDAMERFGGSRPSGFLQKPYRLTELIDTVRGVCERRH